MSNIESFIDAVKKYKHIMIIIVGSPDPDAIASSYAVKCILSSVSINSDIIISKKLSLSQNKAFVKYLQIPLIFKESLSPQKYDAYIITDFQNNIIEGISEHIPCAAHIDHHAEIKGGAADFTYINTKAGSTSSMIALMLKDHSDNLKRKDLVSICTALMFGIQTDTDEYIHATKMDGDAVHYLSEYADNKIINKLNGIAISSITVGYYRKALENQHVYKDWHIYGAGYIDIGNRDSIAIIADLLLKKQQDCQTVIVYAIVEDKKDLFLDVSIRTKLKKLDINSLIKNITTTGGGRIYKGAYQIKLDYFRDCHDKQLLFQLVELATVEKMKKARDNILKTEISTLYGSALKSVSSFFKK